MSDWIEWKGGECPVPADTAVAVHLRLDGWKWGEPYYWSWAHCGGSKDIVSYRVINQHLIDAARLEGIRLGLEAAATAVCRREIKAAPSLEKSGDCHLPAEGRFAGLAEATDLIRALNPETIAKEVQHD